MILPPLGTDDHQPLTPIDVHPADTKLERGSVEVDARLDNEKKEVVDPSIHSSPLDLDRSHTSQYPRHH